MKGVLENSKISGRCLYCGKKERMPSSSCCSKECYENMKKLSEERKKKDLCVYCGNSLYVGKDGKKYGACYDCVLEFSLAMKGIGEGLDKLKEGCKNGKQ